MLSGGVNLEYAINWYKWRFFFKTAPVVWGITSRALIQIWFHFMNVCIIIESICFCYVTMYLKPLVIFMLKYAFIHKFCHCTNCSWLLNMSEMEAIRSQARHIAANGFKVYEEEDMNGALFALLSQYTRRESKLTVISSRKKYHKSTLSQRIRPTPLRSHVLRGKNDFDKCVMWRTIIDIYGIKYSDQVMTEFYFNCVREKTFGGGKTILIRLLRELGFSWTTSSPELKNNLFEDSFSLQKSQGRHCLCRWDIRP